MKFSIFHEKNGETIAAMPYQHESRDSAEAIGSKEERTDEE